MKKRTAPVLCPICGEPLKRSKRDSFLWVCDAGMAEQSFRLGVPSPGGPHDDARRYAWNNAELKFCKAHGADQLPSSEWAPWASAINVDERGHDAPRALGRTA